MDKPQTAITHKGISGISFIEMETTGEKENIERFTV
jgi:hypothetical protein